jgi:nicotinate-nucleotide adenylyltransferase
VSFTKIGVLGGTFDPVHFGHLQLAESAMEECALDQVLFIPAALPPHKKGTTVTSFAHRAAMLQLASKTSKSFGCNLIESQLPKPSYTIDTLQQLQKYYGDQVRLSFIMGADAFLDIVTWKAYKVLLGLVTVIISLREGYQDRMLLQLLEELGYGMQGSNRFRKGNTQEVRILKASPAAVSSSSIRAKIGRGESVHNLVPQAVLRYIQKHMLYQTDLCNNGCSDT